MRFGNISTAVTLESFNNASTPSLTLFLYGCNFRCGFCHNAAMLGNVPDDKLMTEEHLNKVLKHAKRTWKKTIVICGGEPTMSPHLKDLLRYLKHDWEFEIKLDTNGSRPDILKEIIEEKLVDFIGMDIKGTPEEYKPITGTFDNLEKIKESIELVKTLPDYEFRTTILPNIHKKEDLKKIGELIKGAKRYSIQQFRPDLANGCLDPEYCKLQKMPKETLKNWSEEIKPFVKEVRVR